MCCTYFAPHIPSMPHLSWSLFTGHTPQWGSVKQNKSAPTPGPSRRCNHGWRIFWPPHIYICMWTGARPGEGGGPLDWRLLNWTFQTQHSIFQFASNILYFCGNTRMEPLYSLQTQNHTRFTNIPSLYSKCLFWIFIFIKNSAFPFKWMVDLMHYVFLLKIYKKYNHNHPQNTKQMLEILFIGFCVIGGHQPNIFQIFYNNLIFSYYCPQSHPLTIGSLPQPPSPLDIIPPANTFYWKTRK